MRWGDAKKAPPLTRSRGMFAASLLVVAVMATYASLAVISLTAGGPFSFPTSLPGSVYNGFKSAVVSWQAPDVKHLVKLHPTPGQASPFADITFVDFGSIPAVGGARQLNLTNTSSATLPLHVSVSPSAPGINAQFHHTGTQTM